MERSEVRMRNERRKEKELSLYNPWARPTEPLYWVEGQYCNM